MTKAEAIKALERYCGYQERCHAEVESKLASLGVYGQDSAEVIVHLINSDFLNEERFARAFARGKHRIKQWGRIRITGELKQRHISSYNIRAALEEISEDEYLKTFNMLSERIRESIIPPYTLEKIKKFHDLLYRKGYESNLIQDKLQSLQ